ncbi:MAG: hypothetical protein ACREJM_13295, partial [Candidatus Saccharimonadales bacterium]
MPRACLVCSDAGKAKLAGEMIGAGATDQAIADAIGMPGNAGRMSVQRHSHKHVVAPIRAVLAAADKHAPRRERAQLIALAEAGDPTAYLQLEAIVGDLRRVHDRLERTADAAEQDNQRLAVASLSAQQISAAEARA